jgi:hypothetical protein
VNAPAELAVVEVGDLRTVAVAGGVYRRIGSASVNDAGTVVFAADTAGGSGIVEVRKGRSQVLVREGQAAPGGGRFASFGEVDLGDDGSLLFQATLCQTEATEGVFLRTAGGIRVVARAEAASYHGLTLVAYRLPSGPYHRLGYVADTPDGRSSLVIWPSYRGPSTVLTTGDTVAGGVLEGFSVSRLGFAVCAVAQVRSDTGARRLALLASEDQLIWGAQLQDGARLPDLGRISRLLHPPGMYVHHGLVAVELDSGRTVLATRTGGSDPEVFAQSADPAPGIPDRQITRFGPPVSNHGLPDGGPCGIASMIELDDGTTALWLGVFAGQQPMIGAAVVPLVADDDTDDQPPAQVAAFRPIKLTNTGILLLRSSLDVEGKSVDGLVQLDRLFDWAQAHPQR